MSRRRGRGAAIVAVCAAGALLAAGCSSSTKPAAQHRPSATPTSQGPAAITLGIYGPAPVVAAYRAQVAAFEAKKTDVRVTVKTYASARAAETAAESATPPDVFLADAGSLPDLVAGKHVQHVDDLLAERKIDFGDGYERGALEVFSADAELQCMPVAYSPMVLYYNTDLLDPQEVDVRGKAHNPAKPFKMDELAQAATLATGPGHRGIAIAPTLEQLAPFVWSAGGTIVDDESKPTALTLASSPSTKGIAALLAVVRNPQTTYTAKQLARRSALTRFERGGLAMMLGYRDLVPVLRAHHSLHFDVMAMPRVTSAATVGTSDGLCISAATRHREFSADLIASLVSDDSMSRLAETGYVVPASLDVLNDDAFLQPGQEPEHAQAYLDSLRGTQLMPDVATWPRVVAATRHGLAGLWYDANIDPLADRLTALDTAAAAILSPPTATPSPSTSPSASATPSSGG